MLPEHGVAIIMLANFTYASSPLIHAARILAASGGLSRRVTVPAPALLAARDAIGRLIERWDDATAQRAFGASFFLERSAVKLRTDFEKLRTEHRACQPSASITAENALRGTWRLTCENGWIDVRVTLAPTMPPRIQLFEASVRVTEAKLMMPGRCAP